jgi:putative chitinase
MQLMRIAAIAVALTSLWFPTAAQVAAPDAAAIARFSPRARADVISTIGSRWQLVLDAGINTPLRLHHFFAQIATETGGMRLLEEDLHYSASRLLEIFPARVSEAQAHELAHKPMAIANHVYNGRLGNRPPMDGWTYRGSGLIQLTGRANFAARSRELNMPLEENPDLVRAAPMAFETAVAYWTARNINAAADADDIVEVRRLVNGGSNGLAESRVWLARARKLFAEVTPEADRPAADEVGAIQSRLMDLGFLERKPLESTSGRDTAAALRRFQESRGLEATGRYDDDTLYELTNPQRFKAD